jgi:hypothetical protein
MNNPISIEEADDKTHESNDKSSSMSPRSSRKPEQGNGPPPKTASPNTTTPKEQENMETDERQTALNIKLDEDKRRKSTGRKLHVPPPVDTDYQMTSTELETVQDMDDPQTSDESKSQDDTETIPERSKKIKVDKRGMHPRRDHAAYLGERHVKEKRK